MRIALWNGSGLDNIGDRLLDQANRVELGKRIPSATFETFSPWSEGTNCKLLSVDGDGHWSGEGAFDAIVIGGGALLMGPPFSHPGMQSFFLGPHPERFRDHCFVAWNAVCSGSQFAAPLQGPWRAYVRLAAMRIDNLTVRNPRTRDFLHQCEVAEPITVVPDPVVTIRAPSGRWARAIGRRRIGIALARPAFPEEFLRVMADSAAVGLQAENPAVTRFPTSPNPAKYDEHSFSRQLRRLVQPLVSEHDVEIAVIRNIYGDEKPAALLVTLLGDSCRHVTFLEQDSKRLMAWVETLDCLVASRLHYCVLALVAGTPVVALDPYYSNILSTSKLGEFMSAGQGLDCWIPLATALDGEVVVPALIERALSYQDRLSDVHARVYHTAATHYDRLAENIRLGVGRRERSALRYR